MDTPLVLVVDDAPELRELVERVLTRHGYRVRTVNDGDGAMRVLDQGGVDLLITDVVMPGRDGIEVLLDVQEQYPQLPVIVMSGGGMFDPTLYLDNATGLGAHRTLRKPFTMGDLLDAVRELVSPPASGGESAG